MSKTHIEWTVCQIPFPMGDRDILVTHYNTRVREDLEKHVSKEIVKFEQSNNEQDWSIDDLEEYLKSKNYTILPTVRVTPFSAKVPEALKK